MEDHRSVHAPIPGLGLRSLKTALAVMLTALLYAIPFFGKNPTFACIGAIFGMGADMEESRRSGGNRFFGTIIGGFIGLFLYWGEHLFFPEGNYWLRLPGNEHHDLSVCAFSLARRRSARRSGAVHYSLQHAGTSY